MNTEPKSWKYLGLLALALTAGAVRWEADLSDRRGMAGFTAAGGATETAACDRLDAGWLGECTRPDVVLAVQ